MKHNHKKLWTSVCAFSMLFGSVIPAPIMARQSSAPVYAQNTKANDAVTETIIDDTDARFTYSEGDANSGGWTAGGSGEPKATEHYANNVGASVTFTFEGSDFEIFGPKAPNHRMFSVSVDGGEAIEADAYAPSRTSSDTSLFKASDKGLELEDKEHTVTLTILNKTNEAASNVLGMSITFVKAYSGKATEPEEPEKPVFEGFTIVEDMKTTETDGLFKIKYNGSWGGGSYYPDMFHDGYEHYAGAGDSFEMRFVGTKVEMWATKDPRHGKYDFYIDGEKVGSASATADPRVHQQLIYTTPELENKEHTLKVELPASSDMSIQLDYLKVYHEEMAPTAVAIDTEEKTLLPGGTTKLNASVTPWICEGAELVWSSSDEKVATVDNKGNVTAAEDLKTKSTATITVAAADNPAIKASCKVTVDPTLAVVNAYVGNEKLLQLPEEYEELSTLSKNTFNGTLWLGDQINSKINVAAMSKDLKNVEVTFSDFVNENGDKMPAPTYGWLETTKANIGRGNGGAPVKDFPDKIANPGKIDIEAGTIRFAWLSFTTDTDTVPGTYTGKVMVNADGLDAPIENEYTLEVIGIEQPDEELVEVQIWQHPFGVADYYLGLGETPTGGICNEKKEDFYFTDAHFDLMRDSIKEYVATGGHDAVANIVDQAWNHQSYYNDLSMVQWTKKADGTWEFDYTWYDAWINFMIECGVIDPATNLGQIKAYSIVPWNNQVAYFDEASNSTKKQSYKPGSDGWKEIWTAFLTDYLKHSEEKGWLDITYVSMDERGLSDLEPAVELIHSIKTEDGKRLKISSALNYSAPEYYDFTDKIDDISVNLGNTNKTTTRALSEHRREKGLKTTMYTCTGDYPGNFMISDPGDQYWTPLYSIALGADGFMRWAYDNYLYDMHGNATYRYWEPGDGWYIYPLKRGSEELIQGKNFYSTPRYEMFKQGVRDAAKVRYLLASDLDDAAKAELQASIDAMSKPAQSGNGYGSAVASNEQARMSVHTQTAAVADATAKAAEVYAEAHPVNPDGVGHILNVVRKFASTLKQADFLDKGWTEFEAQKAKADAAASNPEATDKELDDAALELNDSVIKLRRRPNEDIVKELKKAD